MPAAEPEAVTVESTVPLVDVMEALGVKKAFVYGQADFSGVDGTKDLFVGTAIHKTFVAVDEKGTEAAAATVVSKAAGAAPAPSKPRIKVKTLVTERVAPGTVFLPFHFSGRWQGADMLAYYPKGAVPIVRGEAVNTATTYGYDSVTMMQETKTTICNIEKA